MNIGIIGTGISGILSAYLLGRHHSVTLFEKNDRLGGHTNTVLIPDGPDEGLAVDTGFIVFNQRTYPNFIEFLKQLDVAHLETNMSFSYECKASKVSYASRSLDTLFADRTNLLRPGYFYFLYEMVRFIKKLQREYLSRQLEDITLGEYLRKNRFSRKVAEQFIVPMAAAIWSASDAQTMAFPIRTFAQFYENHGLLNVIDNPVWYTVEGGSHSYIKAFLKRFSGEIITDSPVKGIKRLEDQVQVILPDGSSREFDKVVIATHADEALNLLTDPTEDEKRLLSVWRYSDNKTWLHTDASFMPKNKRSWASWNYVRDPSAASDSAVTVTYHMNRLQQLETSQDYFVTLNPDREITRSAVIKEIGYTHPVYDTAAFASQPSLDSLNGRKNTYFCGSYFGYGFHEDGAKSAVNVANHFEIAL